MVRYGFFILIIMLSSCAPSQKDLMISLLKESQLYELAIDPKHEVQIIYTQIDRDSVNAPSFTTHKFQIDSSAYFYPASTVKFPVALFALERLNDLDKAGLDMYTTMLTDSAHSGQTTVLNDSTSQNGLPSIAHYLKKIFIVSDNDAYNRLYEFLGPEYINEKLKKKGLVTSHINHRLAISLSWDENMHSNPVRFVDNDSLIFFKPLEKNTLEVDSSQKILKGKAYMNGEDQIIPQPFDFTLKNKFSLQDQHTLLLMSMFPDEFGQLELTDDQFNYLYQCMSQLPKETLYPDYAGEGLPDGYGKFLMFDQSDVIPDHIRSFNKIGQAYGYLIDNAYIVDFKNNIEFVLSVVIHVNANETYNDGIYEYDSIGFPFMKQLGQRIYQHELKRNRKFSPDLSRFKVNYDNASQL